MRASSCKSSVTWLPIHALLVMLVTITHEVHSHSFVLSRKVPPVGWNIQLRQLAAFPRASAIHKAMMIRGGSYTEEEINVHSNLHDAGDLEEEKKEPEGEEDVGDYDYSEESEESDDYEIDEEGVQIEVNVEKYDDMLVPSIPSKILTFIAVTTLSKKIVTPASIRLLRGAFILYLLIHQLFLWYVRIRAKLIDDQTPVELKSPLSSVLQSQLGNQAGDNSVIKSLASSLLSSKSTVFEYDLKESRSMQSGILFSMAFMWFVHFKMGQVQPLLFSVVNGFTSLVYSPLFQVYVLGRNLERPFKNPSSSLLDAYNLQNGTIEKEGEADEECEEGSSVVTEEEDEEPVDTLEDQLQSDTDRKEPIVDGDNEEEEEEKKL